MTTGMALPLELAVLLGVGCTGVGAMVGVWAGQARARRQLDPRRPSEPDPLRPLFQPSVLTQAIDRATRASTYAGGDRAVLHGRIDQFAALQPEWNAATRDAVRAHIAAVMRAGLRRDDRIALAEGTAGEGFTIVIPGADERAAIRIAERLRRALGKLRLPQMGTIGEITARFGVAAERPGDDIDTIDQRARCALEAALAHGADHVVPASAIEEIILLPAPAKASAEAG